MSKGDAAAYEWELTHGNVAAGRIYGTFYEPSGGALMQRYITGMSTGWNVLAYRGPSPVKDADSDHYRNSPTEVTSTAGTTFTGTYTNNAADVRIGFRDDTPAGQAFEGTLCHVAIFAGEVDLTDVYAAAALEGWF